MSKRSLRTSSTAEQSASAQSADDWRLFVAIPLPSELKSRISDVGSVNVVADLPLRFVDPSLAHLTLHFLGATPPERAELIVLSLQRALAGQRRAELLCGELGLFPGSRKPRVLWMGIGGDTNRLVSIHRVIGDALNKIGVEIEKRSFRPHLTIGRVRDGAESGVADQFQSALQSPEVQKIMGGGSIVFTASEVHLMRSHLERSGPRYETIRAFPLA